MVWAVIAASALSSGKGMVMPSPWSQGGAAVTAGGTVACGGLVDHRGRRVDAEHTVAGSHQDGGGAALAEADVEDRARLGEVELGEGAVVGAGGVLDHQASDDAAQQSARVPGLSGSETPDEPGTGGPSAVVIALPPVTRWRIIVPQAAAVSSG